MIAKHSDSPGRRRADLAKIHIAKKDLRLDDATYRQLLSTVASVESAADLDAEGRRKVLRHIHQLGWEPSGRGPSPMGSKARGTEAQIGKVGALLAASGRPWSYAHSIANRMFHVKRVQWLRADQLSKLIAALSIDHRRRGMSEPR